jgi:hypothetical protein
MKKAFLVAVLAFILITVGYGQPYQPEHLLHLCGQPEVHRRFGQSIIGVGDVNNDGYHDFAESNQLVGAPTDGSFSVYYGGNPPDTIPDIIFPNPYPYAGFDVNLWNLGDVNGDGYEDIGTYGAYQSEDICRVFIYYGGNVLDTIPDIEISKSTFRNMFGSKAFGLGDVNGDGYDDIAVHASNYPCNPSCQAHGKVWIFFGGCPMDTIADWEKEGSQYQSLLGWGMSGGDLNGDGYSDFIVNENMTFYNLYYIYFGNTTLDTVPDLIIDSRNYPNYVLSAPTAIIDNFNGDGYADLMIPTGGPQLVAVLFGGDPFNTGVDVELVGLAQWPSDTHISCAGDVNADGYHDVIVGQGDMDQYGGVVLVYLGGVWINPQYAMRWHGTGEPWNGCGEDVCNPGDINGDGVDDIMFASYRDYLNEPGCVDIWLGDSAFVAEVPEGRIPPMPQRFQLLPPYPNPFNSSLTIPFEVSSISVNDISLIIYNVLGQEVVDLTSEVRRMLAGQPSATLKVIWDGQDGAGRDCGSGIYLVTLQSPSVRHVQKAVLLR